MGDRIDVVIYNEACAFSLVDGTQLQRIVGSGNAWELLPSLDSEMRALVMELAQDDSFNARVVVDDELAGDEMGWIGRATAVLEIGDNGLVLAGGFDADVFADLFRDGESEYCARIEVPEGRWRVDLYTYITSVNADACLGVSIEEMAQRFAAEFEGSGSDGPWPRWLARLCFNGWDGVDQHPVWADPAAAFAEERLEIDDDRRATIEFLVQLRAVGDDVVVTPRDNKGMLDPGAGGRWLSGLPQSLASDNLEPEEDELDELISGDLDEEEDELGLSQDLGWSVDREEVLAQLESIELRPIDPLVEIALHELDLVAILGWCISRSARCSLAFELPDAAADVPWPWPQAQAPVDGSTGLVVRSRLSVGDTRKAITGLSGWIEGLPVGTRQSVVMVYSEDDEVLLALSGLLEAAAWRIDTAAPEIASDGVTGMLEVARWVDGCEPFHAASKEELEGVLSLIEDWQRAKPRRIAWHASGLEVSVGEEERIDLAVQVFRHRFGRVLPGLEGVLETEAAVAAQLEAILARVKPSGR